MSWRLWILVAAAAVGVALGSFWLGTRAHLGDGLALSPSQQPALGVGVVGGKVSTPVEGVGSTPATSPARVGELPIAEQLSAEERRKRTGQVQAEMSALLAKGGTVSPEQAIVLIDKLERLSSGGAEAAHFQSLKGMLENTSKIQVLNAELQRVSSSTTAEDVARRQVILAELRQLGERVAATAADIQTRLPAASAAAGSQQ